jgi:cytoskeletal protein CcmA (bactofilin family)
LFSRNATVRGHVKGDVIGFSTELRIEGVVDGNVRAFAQTLTLSSAVAKNVTGWVGDLDLEQKASVGGTMMVGDTNLVLEGSVGGDLMTLANMAEINGTLGRDATIRAGRLTIGPNAQIAGQTKYIGSRPPDISPSAKLGSPIQVTIPKRGPDYTRLAYYWHQVLFCGAGFLLGLVILLVAPAFFFDATQACKKVGAAIGFGALFLFATPIAAIIVCFTIVGLSVGIPAILLWLIALYSAKIFVGAWLGERALGTRVGVGPALGRLALGLAILQALSMIPFLGGLISLLVVMWGIGGVVLALHRRMSPPVEAAAVVAAA